MVDYADPRQLSLELQLLSSLSTETWDVESVANTDSLGSSNCCRSSIEDPIVRILLQQVCVSLEVFSWE